MVQGAPGATGPGEEAGKAEEVEGTPMDQAPDVGPEIEGETFDDDFEAEPFDEDFVAPEEGSKE